MSDEAEYSVDTPSEELWNAIDELRQKRDKLMTISRAEEMGFNQRQDMYKRQVTNPAMKANAETQLRMMQQQRTFAEQNLRRNTQKIDVQIDTINRLLEEKKVR
ncbi:hypothetical protein B5M09_009328, partial [Aphanomyces astaci]